MKMIFRWHGPKDPISLEYINQIPGLYGIVSSLYDLPLGEPWKGDDLRALIDAVARHDLKMEVVDSFRIHEDIKLGKPSRDAIIEQYKQTLKTLAASGVKLVCYNFMPIFDWTRTDMGYALQDGSSTLAFDTVVSDALDPSEGLHLPGLGTKYEPAEIRRLLNEYEGMTEEELWCNLEYFLQAILPTAKSLGLRMAIHPDDPPRSIFGLPRILKNGEDLRRLLAIDDAPANGLTFCTGSLGSSNDNDVPALLAEFVQRQRVYFVHARNVKLSSNGDFYESAHPTADGSLDMASIVQVLVEAEYDGYMRPDHGRMIWGETGVPGYGLYDRALGIMYLQGLWEGIRKQRANYV